MPTALLLSPDDQAVSAISAVLEEMSVTCERPLDGVSAAQKLHSHTFDLVLVDCDNLPAAKLIFDVCRRGKGNNNPVPIAIVDGRAGLPTAFRLGAELILTKPVAKDQARSTIRTAVSRIRKVETVQAGQVNPSETNALPPVGGLKNQDSPIPLSSQEMSALTTSDTTTPQGLALAAAAGVKSPISASVPAVLRSLASPEAEAPATEAESEPPVAQKSGSLIPAKLLKVEGETKAQRPVLSFDSHAQGKQNQSTKGPTEQDLSKQDNNQDDQSEQEEKKQSRLVALLVLLTAVAGLYASWMYEPGFRALAQPLIERVLGMEHQLQHSLPAPSPAKPAAQPKSVPADPAASAQPPGLAKPSPNAAAAPPAPVTSLGAPVASSLAGGDKTGATQNNVNESVTSQSNLSQSQTDQSQTGQSQSKPGAKIADAKQTAGKPSDAELPGEATAVVLSSKGAENRLVHSEQPTHPAGTGSHQAKGPMVLKAVVDENGKVAGARVIQGDSALASAAVSAVKQWRYRPYIHDGKAEPFQTVVVLDFQQP